MRLRISKNRLADFNGKQSILIEKMELIDPDTGAVQREVDMNKELSRFLHKVEIDLTNYSKYKKMIEKNPNLKKLVSNFNLTM